jgi:hypothetical protein
MSAHSFRTDGNLRSTLLPAMIAPMEVPITQSGSIPAS